MREDAVKDRPSRKAVRKARAWAESMKLSDAPPSWGPNDSASLSPATAAALEAIQDVERLEALGERILEPEIQDLGRSAARIVRIEL